MVAVLIKQILAMVAMMAIGVVLAKRGKVDAKGATQLSTIAMYVATPAVIIQAFAVEFNPEQLINAAWVALSVVIALAVSTLISRVVLARSDRVGQFSVIFNNAGFIGIPIIQVLLGTEYVFYVTIIIAICTFYLWTYGVVLISGDRSMVSLKKVATNPAIISLGVGLVLFFLPIELPSVVSSVLSTMGSLNTGLAMIVIGVNLGMANIGLMFSDLRLFRAGALRLIAVPLAVLAIMLVMPIPYEVKMTLIVAQATPCAAATSMLAQLFGGDYQYGTGLVIMTALLSMVSMPIILTLAIAVI